MQISGAWRDDQTAYTVQFGQHYGARILQIVGIFNPEQFRPPITVANGGSKLRLAGELLE